MIKVIPSLVAILLSTSALAESHLPKVDAEVRRVDTSAGKVTLRHAEIPNLDMPPMTMVFQVQHPSMLVELKPGDNVRVTLDQVNGAYTVQSIEPRQ